MENFEVTLYKALSICNGELKYLKEFTKIYTFTTENINGYLKYFNLKNKSLLTVGSSLNQILNAYYYGAKDITLYDINPFAKYYGYLKITGILSLSYREFQAFFFKHGTNSYYNKYMFEKNLFNKIKPNLRLLDYESFLFFDELFSNYQQDEIRNHLFDDDEYRNNIIKNFNIYLKNENNYNKLKNIIKNINFKYINGNIFEDNIEGKYDNIILSNLCTTTNLKTLKLLLEKLDTINLSENGSILIGYLWNTDFNSNEYEENWYEIYKLPIAKKELKQFISEHHNINSAHDFLWQQNKKNDLALIYRKSKKV